MTDAGVSELGESVATTNRPAGDRAAPVGTQAAPRPGGVRAPALSLPKGGGAIRGIDAKFSVNAVTGTASLSVPIPASPGRAGFGPQLALSYDSGAGNGPFGWGWRLDVPAVARSTDKRLPLYRDSDDSDVFVLSGAEELVPALDPQGGRETVTRSVDGVDFRVDRYRPRVEGPFARIERWTRLADEDVHWRSITRDNVTTWYGRDSGSRVADPVDPRRVFSWLICETRDDVGNAVVYEYDAEDSTGIDLSLPQEANRTVAGRTAARYLTRVRYGNTASHLVQPDLAGSRWLFELVFDYLDDPAGEARRTQFTTTATPDEAGRVLVDASFADPQPWGVRKDPHSSFKPGFDLRTYRLCSRVFVVHHFPDQLGTDDCLVRALRLEYEQSEVAALLARVTQCGYVRQEDGRYLERSLPPLDVGYSRVSVDATVHEADADALAGLPAGLDEQRYEWVDLDGDGLPGVLTEQGGTWLYKRNLSPLDGGAAVTLAPPEQVALRPSLPLAGAQLVDLTGSGTLDLVALRGSESGFHARRAEHLGWDPFRSFASAPAFDAGDPNLRFVDLDGDGRSDVLVTEQDRVTWYQSLAEQGFGEARHVPAATDEERGPVLVFADGTESIHLADMSGDGLTDLVRIRNSEICYWPNLGGGRFGAKVAMATAPLFDLPDAFRPSRVRLADVDGSGTTDVLYLGDDAVRIYFNQAGNSWSEGAEVSLPQLDDAVSVAALDLLGRGTSCLVWSSPLAADGGAPLRYVDLMGGTKPHLLVSVANNLGAETHVTYAPSTRFYLEDRRAGRPWRARLPFPVHVVERVETLDRVSGTRLVTRSAYHHGHYDGVEREFRGFGFVERWDTEELGALAPTDVPPLLTRTWFHTGALAGGDALRLYADEYYREPGLTDVEAAAQLPADRAVPAGLDGAETREALRALKGSLLREETYALDGSPKEPHPYRVLDRSYRIRLLQPRAGNEHAVFLAHGDESLEQFYERNPDDPRVTHSLVLEVDAYGNEAKTASVAYGRRRPDPALAAADQADQARTHVRYVEHERTNAVDLSDAYRTPVVSATRQFELTGYAPGGAAGRFVASDFVTIDATDPSGLRRLAVFDEEIPYEQAPTNGRQRRLVGHELVLYRADDLTAPLAPNIVESRAIAYETYRLAFTPGLVASGFGGRVDDALLEECRYLHAGGDAGWWAPSGRVLYAPPGSDAPADELAYAQQHFFLPVRFRDPFHSDAVHTESVVSYDSYDLLVEETVDALGNRVTAGERALDPAQPLVRRGNDYRVLAASVVMDPNRNRSEVRFDALGLVAAHAVAGKPEDAPAVGDEFDDSFRADLDGADVEALLAAPTGGTAAALLGGATTRYVYDLEAIPACSVVLARETHVSSLAEGEGTPIQVSFSYSDGLGREIQRKLPAEPGPVPQRNPDGSIVVGPDGHPVPAPGTADPRWIGSGWVVYDNKGQPVRELEPFFTDRHTYESDARVGVGTLHLYDAAGRCVVRLHPDRTWTKALFDAWTTETWDANDTVLVDPAADADAGPYFAALPQDAYLPTWYAARQGGALGPEEAASAAKAAVHAATATVAHADSLGHTFLTVAKNRYAYSDATPGDPPVEEEHELRTVYDLDGQPLSVIDPLGRTVVRYEYDLLGDRFHVAGMEGGEHWLLADVAGAAAYSWDGLDRRVRTVFDQLRRSVESHLSDAGAAEVLVGRSAYGESTPNAEATNVRGRLVRVEDQAGVETTDGYDFKGNPLGHSRTLAQLYSVTLDWSGVVALDDTVYAAAGEYDALDRPVRLVAPDGSVFRPQYGRASLPVRLDVNLRGAAVDGAPTWTPFVARADYDAKGRPLLVEHGAGAAPGRQGVVTTYEYDSQTFRLARLVTRRPAAAYPDDCPQPPPDGWPGCQVQSLTYTYDPVGNVTSIRDDAQQTIFFRNMRVDPTADFTYDARYRLIEARGREHVGQAAAALPWSYEDAGRVGLPAPGDGNAMARYVERYVYDAAGNLTSTRHRGSDPTTAGWTRTYAYAEPSALEPEQMSNRLTSATVGSITDTYSTGGDGYDANGNLRRMPQLQEMRWDFKDQLRMTRRQAVDADDADGVAHAGERTWYVYDGNGGRTRKVTELAGGQVKDERISVGGFEIYRNYGPNALVRETLHVMFGPRRIALVETRTDPAQPEQLIRYQFGNALGSAVLELDDAGQVITYEEYAPYGSSTYQAVRSQVEAPKRYRYGGKERDEESGLYFHGARYYAPWIARWTNPDPAGAGNLYVYCLCNPLRLTDPDGRNPKPPPHQVGSYGKVAGDHVHQVASRTNAPGAKRTSAPQYRQGLSVSTKNPAYNDKAAQRVERKINRAQWGEDTNGRPADKGSYKGKVTVEATGDTTVGSTAPAQPSPWFEDMKSYYKLIEAGVPPEEASKLVLQSAAQLDAAGAVPQRVPGAPKSVPRALQQGQTLSPETPTELTAPADAPAPVAPPEPNRAPGGGGAVGTVTNVAGVAAIAGNTLVALHEGRTGDAAKTVVQGGGAMFVMSRVPALVPLAVMKSTIDSYDQNVERHSFAVGDWVSEHNGGAAMFPLLYAISPETANRYAGGVASAASATGESLFQGTFGVTGRAIGEGAAVVYIRLSSDEYTIVPWRSQWWADHF